jgi:hypothetical protein
MYMSQQLESLCFDICSQGIVLNDNIARLTSCSTDDLLTTMSTILLDNLKVVRVASPL